MTDFEILKDQFEDVQKQFVGLLKESFPDLCSRTQEIENQIGGFGSTLAELSEKLEELRASIGQFDPSALQTMSAKIDDLQKQISDFDAQMQTFESSLSSTDTKLAKAETDISALQSKVSLNETTLQTHSTRLDSIDSQLSSHTTRLSSAEGKINTLTEDVSNLKTSVSQTQTDLDSVEESVLAHGKQLTTLEGALDTIQKLQTQLDTLQNEVIPNLESQIGQGGEENWEVLYDKDSTNGAVNLGKPNGILTDGTTISEFPDLILFKKLRVTFWVNGYFEIFTFDISIPKDNVYTMIMAAAANGVMYMTRFSLFFDRDGKRVMIPDNLCRITFGANNLTRTYFNGTDSNSKYFFYGKIEAVRA